MVSFEVKQKTIFVTLFGKTYVNGLRTTDKKRLCTSFVIRLNGERLLLKRIIQTVYYLSFWSFKRKSVNVCFLKETFAAHIWWYLYSYIDCSIKKLSFDTFRYGHGLAREAVWMILQPLFAQSNKLNYHTEAMVHIVNFLAMWPLATRELLRRNCSISLNGKEGHNLALDEWVESGIVQPLKKYSTG